MAVPNYILSKLLSDVSPSNQPASVCWSWAPLGHCRSWHTSITTGYEELTHLKRPWSWQRLKAGGEGDNRGWDDWMASPTWWTWVWASSRRWCWTRKPEVPAIHRFTKSRPRLSDGTELKTMVGTWTIRFERQWRARSILNDLLHKVTLSRLGEVAIFESIETNAEN